AAGLEVVIHNDEYRPEFVAARIFAICNTEGSGTVGMLQHCFGAFGIIEMNKFEMTVSAHQLK
ncbi:hypothetical protein A2U01_0111082, partial [Trifolium medium]|nr:hypothetical protein [Trifolium medium]